MPVPLHNNVTIDLQANTVTTCDSDVTRLIITMLGFYLPSLWSHFHSISYYIIDLLAGGRKDVKSLWTLSQACKYMVPLCRKHFFSSLCVGSNSKSVGFSNWLLKNPDIARYMKSLYYGVYCIPSSGHGLNILNVLKKYSSLMSIVQFVLLSSRDFGWNNLTDSIWSSLVSLIQLPTVSSLGIYSFNGFPATALSECGNLINLCLGELSLAYAEVNQVISHSKIPTLVSLYINTDTCGLAALLNSASLHAGGPIVNFSHLQKAKFHVQSSDDIDQVNELIRVTTQLEYLQISGE